MVDCHTQTGACLDTLMPVAAAANNPVLNATESVANTIPEELKTQLSTISPDTVGTFAATAIIAVSSIIYLAPNNAEEPKSTHHYNLRPRQSAIDKISSSLFR